MLVEANKGCHDPMPEEYLCAHSHRAQKQPRVKSSVGG